MLTKYVKNCDGVDSTIKVINSSISVKETCDVTAETCSEVFLYENAQIFVKLIKNTLTIFEGNFDICDKKKRRDLMKVVLAIFGIPNKCPIDRNQTICLNGKDKITTLAEPTKRILPIFLADAKDSTISATIKHDKGKVSCFEALINVK